MYGDRGCSAGGVAVVVMVVVVAVAGVAGNSSFQPRFRILDGSVSAGGGGQWQRQQQQQWDFRVGRCCSFQIAGRRFVLRR